MAATNTTAIQQVLQKAHYVDSTNDSPGLYGNPLILNRIFDLLVIMINLLQKTAAAQANRLNLLTSWQQAYTAEMNQIHAFVAKNGDGQFSGGATSLDNPTDTNVAKIRQDLNT